jgi:adenylate cyclase
MTPPGVRLQFDGYTVDLDGRILSNPDGADVPLTTAEFDLLATFVRAPGRVLSRDHLRLSVAGRHVEAFDRSVDVLVGRLRRKIEPDAGAPSLIVTVTGAGYKFTPRISPAPDAASSGPPSSSAERLSVAVMPFDNLTNDPDRDYFVDGVVEDIIAALSRVGWFRVVARGSTFAYRGRVLSPSQLGRELGVRYVLSGSMRQSGTRFRIITSLVETDTETSIWTERFDGIVDDIFDVQDAITAKVAAAIEPRLIDIEADRAQRQRPANPTAYDCFLRGLAQFYSDTQESMAITLHFMRKAMAADPAYAPPYALAAECLVYRIDYGWSPDREVDRREAARLADAALARDQDDPTVLVLAAHVLSYARHDRVTPLALLERALAINPNLPIAFQLGGWVHLYAGDPAGAAEWFNRGQQLSPLDTRNFIYYSGLAYALIVLGQDKEALGWAQKSVATKPSWSTGWRVLASALVHLGRPEEAKAAAARVREIAPTYRIRITRELYSSFPGLERYLDGLLRAGLPE